MDKLIHQSMRKVSQRVHEMEQAADVASFAALTDTYVLTQHAMLRTISPATWRFENFFHDLTMSSYEAKWTN